MSIFNFSNSNVKPIKRADLTAKERRVLDDGEATTVHRVDLNAIKEVYGENVEFFFSYVRITKKNGEVLTGEALVPILKVEPVVHWSILFCPPGRLTDTGEFLVLQLTGDPVEGILS